MLFLKEKPSNLLIALLEGNHYLSQLAKLAGCTYVYVTNIMSTLESKGLVETEFRGKFRVVKLTQKGKELALLLKQIKEKESS